MTVAVIFVGACLPCLLFYGWAVWKDRRSQRYWAAYRQERIRRDLERFDAIVAMYDAYLDTLPEVER